MRSPPSLIRYHVLGRRSERQPLAYSALRPVFADALIPSARDEADLLIFGHPDDLVEAAPQLAACPSRAPVVYLSEEPFWDTVGPLAPFDRAQTVETPAGPLPFTCLNHHTSTVFDFAKIPYFLLTETYFPDRYARAFAANARLGPEDWAARFARAPVRAAFVAENRLSPKLDVRFPDYDVRGLCPFRTGLAIRYRTQAVLRAGRGWPAGATNRVALTDWHSDKLALLEGRCVFVSALENTHQAAYVSEKIFDAFAVGGVPLYYASPDHAVHRIAPDGGWLNLYGRTVADAVAAIDAFALDGPFLERYCATQQHLAAVFADPDTLAAERARLGRAVSEELWSLCA